MKRCPSCKSAFPADYTLCPRDGSSLITIGEWAEGTLVRGKYRILAKIGQGGMGSVYKVMHTRFKEVRAIKVISPELASDTSFVRRFEQEAIITRKLQHPNAVRVEDIDEAEDGRPFIVMEYIEGRSLKDVIENEAPMDVERVCAIIKQAATALDAAHTLGLVHRDIKPANIALVRSENESGTVVEQVKILDFGIAKLKEAQLEDSKASHLSHLTLTSTGVVIGTPAYMSPEQARGMKGDELDGRSDLYSLGIVMYQMLTGNLPLKADSTIEQLMAHINIQPKAIRDVRPDVPEHVATAVMSCLEKKRELRPKSGEALIYELGLAAKRKISRVQRSATLMAQAQVTPQRTAGLPATSSRVARKGVLHSRTWVGALVGVLIAAGFGGTWFLRARRPPVGPEKPGAVTVAAETKSVAHVTAELPTLAPTHQLPANGSSGATSETYREVPSRKGQEIAAVPDRTTPTQESLPSDGPKNAPIQLSTHTTADPTLTAAAVPPSTQAPPAAAPPNLVPSSAVSTPAELDIYTNPTIGKYATVSAYLDNQHLEAARLPDGGLHISQLPTGQHRFKLDVSEYEHYERTVDLAAGFNLESVNLVRAGLSGGQEAPSEATINQAVSTFEVAYLPGWHRATGRLTISKDGLAFNGYQANAKDNFNLPCSEVVEAKMPSSFVRNNPFGEDETSFHVKGRSKKYYFDTWDKNGVVRDTILRAIRSACNLR